MQKNNSYKQDGALEFPSRVSNNRGLLQEVHNKLEEEEEDPGKTQNNLVSSLAEKAMSVAGPVVPTNSDGEVDQERSVLQIMLFVFYFSVWFNNLSSTNMY